MKDSKIYDGFLFFNELDLLEIRLHELCDVVDKFILVESTVTFSSKKKPLYYLENKERFKEFEDKIIHIVVDDTPDLPKKQWRDGIIHNRHDIEHWQRNQIKRGFVDCSTNDIVMISDIDEIPSKNSIEDLKERLLIERDINVSFKQRFFYYYVNGLNVLNGIEAPWYGTTACLYENFKSARDLRDTKGNNNSVVKAGWHFSYVGGVKEIIKKIESYSHVEFDNNYIKNEARLEDRINKGLDLFDRPQKPRQVYIKIDESFPEHIVNNVEKFKDIIKGKS